ncbi:MAG: KTSC domain-containing protein [bacterium]
MLVERNEIKNDCDEVQYIESVFNSGNILKTTYFPLYNRLYIAFKRGHTYSYGNVTPDVYEKFENSESQGKFFHIEIAKNPDLYPYRKEFTLYPSEINEINNIIVNKTKDDTDTDEQ